LAKLLEGNLLTPQQKQAVMTTLKEKSTVYAGGCRKRGREEEAKYYYHLADQIKKDMTDDG
jgi:hypothetical protein